MLSHSETPNPGNRVQSIEDPVLSQTQRIWDSNLTRIKDLSTTDKQLFALNVSAEMLRLLLAKPQCNAFDLATKDPNSLRDSIPIGRRNFVARAIDLAARVTLTDSKIKSATQDSLKLTRMALIIAPNSYEALITLVGVLDTSAVSTQDTASEKFKALVNFLKTDPFIEEVLPEAVLRFSPKRKERIVKVLRLASQTAFELMDFEDGNRYDRYADCLEQKLPFSEVEQVSKLPAPPGLAEIEIQPSSPVIVPIDTIKAVDKVEPIIDVVSQIDPKPKQDPFDKIWSKDSSAVQKALEYSQGNISKPVLDQFLSILERLDSKDGSEVDRFISTAKLACVSSGPDFSTFITLLMDRVIAGSLVQKSSLTKEQRSACQNLFKDCEKAARRLHGTVQGSGKLHAAIVRGFQDLLAVWKK